MPLIAPLSKATIVPVHKTSDLDAATNSTVKACENELAVFSSNHQMPRRLLEIAGVEDTHNHRTFS